jgi:UbiD family decarboxylase
MIDNLRDFLEELQKRDKLRIVDGADWDLEIGTINELMAERYGPALLFDNIKGYTKGFRVSTNLMHHEIGQKLAFGFPEEMSKLECVADWKEKWRRFEPIAPVQVKDGPIRENVLKGEDIDIYKFPAPKWHTLDGGRYIGTGVITVTRDPDDGWVNFGTYRLRSCGRNTGQWVSPARWPCVLDRTRFCLLSRQSPCRGVFPNMTWQDTLRVKE